MCNGLLYRDPVTGSETCMPLYVRWPYRWWEDPNPPDPLDDLRILAGIQELVSHVVRDGDMQARLTETLRASAEQRVAELPESFQLGHEFLTKTG